jgi:putative nucleotidyltransferase with HDIG domain
LQLFYLEANIVRKLDPHDLEPGMVLIEDVSTPNGQILAEAGSEVTRQLINRMKLYRVVSVVVEGEAPAAGNSSGSSAATAPAPEPPRPKTHIEETKTAKQKVASSEAFQSFQMQYLLCMEELKGVFTDIIDHGKEIESDSLLENVSQLFRKRNTITELFDMLNNMRTIEDSVYAHSLNVALISRMIGRWLRLDSGDLNTLTLAGLLHDIGKAMIPEEVLNKPGSLTDEEFELIKSHPRLGYDVLKSQNIDTRIKNAALMHHERCDGSGYPSGLTDSDIDEFAMIIAIADVYDAMTAARSYRAPLCAFQVISNFERDGFQKYHTKYLLTFLKRIATTYQSNRVVLNDGRGCKIVMLNPNDLSRPIVQFDDKSCLDLSVNRNLYITAII